MFAEHGTLVASLVKWTLLATGVGILAGVGTAIFLRILDWAIGEAARTPWRLLWLPPGFVLAHLLVRFLAPDAEGHGTDKVIEAVHQRAGRIALAVAPVKLAATVVTIAVGGSVGKEGPAAQIGASLASGLASLLRLGRRDRRKVVICGIGAGFATVFGTPIAGAIFGLEVLVLGSLMYDVLYPSFVAGIVGYHVASQLGVRYFHTTLPGLPAPSERMLVDTLLAGVLFGLVAIVLIEALRWTHHLAHRVRLPGCVVAAAGGTAVALGAWLTSDRYLGLGLPTLEATLRGEAVPPEAWLLKIVFTAVSLGTGGSGGIVTPIFFVDHGTRSGHVRRDRDGGAPRGRSQRPARGVGDGDRAVRPGHRALRGHRRDRRVHHVRAPQRVSEPGARHAEDPLARPQTRRRARSGRPDRPAAGAAPLAAIPASARSAGAALALLNAGRLAAVRSRRPAGRGTP
jgi:H+/Cl- antiporter ClcA